MRKNRVIFTCQFCNQEFDVPFSETYRRKAGVRFCSMKCYHADRWGHTGKCYNCNKPAETKYCSPECQKDFWNKNGYKLQRKRRNWVRKIEFINRLGSKCITCGIDDIRVLDINHIDQSKKDRPKDGHYTWGRRFQDWEKHFDNLELLCANCHRILTWEQRNFGHPEVTAIAD